MFRLLPGVFKGDIRTPRINPCFLWLPTGFLVSQGEVAGNRADYRIAGNRADYPVLPGLLIIRSAAAITSSLAWLAPV